MEKHTLLNYLIENNELHGVRFDLAVTDRTFHCVQDHSLPFVLGWGPQAGKDNKENASVFVVKFLLKLHNDKSVFF